MPETVVAPRTVAAVGATQADWVDSICPYLVTEDGAYRSAEPDESHRCAAQDPPSSLPMAFQERFCLGSRHVRCEMYKYAQVVNAAGGIPAEQLQGANAATAARSTAVASSSGESRRPAIIGGAIIGGVIVLVLLGLLLGSCGADPDGGVPSESASPLPQATLGPTLQPTLVPEVNPEPEVTPEPEATLDPDPGEVDPGEATPDPGTAQLEVLYEVQEGEKLLRIAETFGVSRRAILRANEGMADKQPYVEVGDFIIVPVPVDTPIEQLEAIPGYQGIAN